MLPYMAYMDPMGYTKHVCESISPSSPVGFILIFGGSPSAVSNMAIQHKNKQQLHEFGDFPDTF